MQQSTLYTVLYIPTGNFMENITLLVPLNILHKIIKTHACLSAAKGNIRHTRVCYLQELLIKSTPYFSITTEPIGTKFTNFMSSN